MLQPELYENKMLRDAELPIQINLNNWHKDGGFPSHWHEHIELHYIVEGEADFQLNQSVYHVVPGNFLIVNPNELHAATCTKTPYHARVIIFEVAALSAELGEKNYIFRSLVREDPVVDALTARILREFEGRDCAWKQLCKALVLEFLVHLCRNYVEQTLGQQDSARRKKDLERLNAVLCFIEAHYPEPITNAQLAEMICLSEDRFGHLFRDGVGQSPVQYLNDLRLKKALVLLKANRHTVTQVAEAVGFRDYNHFGRLFRKHYGCTPYEVKSGKVEVEENSGIL